MRRLNFKIRLSIPSPLRRLIAVLLLALLWLIVTFTIVLGPRPYRGGLQEGDIAKEIIRAPFDFFVQSDIDEESTEILKGEAADSVNDIYEIDNEKIENSLQAVSLFFDEVAKLKKNKELNEKEKLMTLKEKTNIKLKNNLLSFFINLPDEKIEEAENILQNSLKSVTNEPIITSEKMSELKERADKIIIRNADKDFEKESAVDSIVILKDAKQFTQDLVNKQLKDNKDVKNILTEIVNQVLTDNLVYNEELTEQRKQEAKDAIPPIYHKIKINKNNIIVAKSQLVTKEHTRYLKRLQELQSQKDTKINNIYYYASISLFTIILFLLFWLYLKLYEPEIFSTVRYLVLISLLSFLIIMFSKIISASFLSSYLIPLASISMLIAILLNFRIALVVTVFLSVFVGIVTGEQLSTFLYSLAGGLVGIYSVRNVRRRAQLLKAGLLVGIVSFLIIIAIDLLHNLETEVLLKDSLWGISNGFICAFIVTGMLPILEYLFKITTNISLLELSDLNHPLLKEMVIKAPGTYHHSLIVGNLAENAADSIGANSLLARVGAYYHDIGKLIKPEYFSENQMGFKDKHAKINPKVSSLVITNHIKEGVELAKKHKLNDSIIDFIQQHHGTSLTFYFYQRALEKEAKEDEVEEEEFRYPGPLPQTKETAIVLLADSVEAATRAISQPTAAKIEKTVQKIINNKFIDGQLDECDLSLKDLHKISESFSKLLVGIYHSRVEYPEPNEEKKSS